MTVIKLQEVIGTVVSVGVSRGLYFYTTTSGLRNSFKSSGRLLYALRNEANIVNAANLVADLLNKHKNN